MRQSLAQIVTEFGRVESTIAQNRGRSGTREPPERNWSCRLQGDGQEGARGDAPGAPFEDDELRLGALTPGDIVETHLRAASSSREVLDGVKLRSDGRGNLALF
jgi:hypothetical protein